MSKLIQIYSNSTGLKIADPYMMEKYFPIMENRYFTIQTSSGQQAKCYDYFLEVLAILAPFLSANNISVVQLGGKDDRPLPGCKHFLGVTTLNQSYYILRRSILHIGNDSWLAHAAGALKKPLVSVYGSTSSQVHGPYWSDPDRTVLIDSHRNGRIPSYSNESPKTVNFIPPEKVAQAVLEVLGFNKQIPQTTYFIGPNYIHPRLEYIPDFALDPRSVDGQPLIVRMDLHHGVDHLKNLLLSGRKINLVANKPIPAETLKYFKEQIVGITYEVQPTDETFYLRDLKRTGIKLRVISFEKDPIILSDLRLKFFDVVSSIESIRRATKEDFFRDAETYLNSTIDKNSLPPDLLFRSNKFTLANGKIYPSTASWRADHSIPSVQPNFQPVIDSPEFWEEYDHFRFFILHENPASDNPNQ